MSTKTLPVNNLSEFGIIHDTDPILLPPNAWTAGIGVRFQNGEVTKILGETEVQNPTLTDIQFIMPATKWTSGTPSQVWIHAGLDHVYFTDDGTTDTKITREGGSPLADIVYTGSSDDRWNGCVNQNVLILNNGVDSPQSWVSTKLANLRWDGSYTWATKSWKTKVMRSHKNFLFALQLNTNDGNGMNPNTVCWSEPAEPWAVPTTWDASDTSSITGQVELSSTEGSIIDGLSLRDNFIVYKDSSVYNMGYQGGQFIWQTREISKTVGLFAQGTVVEFQGQHVFMSRDDILLTDGLQFKSIANQKIRNKIFSEISSTLYTKTFAVGNYQKEEIWFCYATENSSYINKAAIWNYTTGAWTFKALPNVAYINYGVLYTTSGTDDWNDSDSWESDSSIWDEGVFTQVVFKLLGATNTSIKLMDTGYDSDGSSYSSYVEKTGIKLGTSSTMKRITAIYPKGVGNMDVYVGRAMHQNDSYTWEGPFNITPETDAQIRCRVTGRYHALRFVFQGDVEHKLQGYDIEYVDTGYGR